jgi:hypothetical protein
MGTIAKSSSQAQVVPIALWDSSNNISMYELMVCHD